MKSGMIDKGLMIEDAVQWSKTRLKKGDELAVTIN